MVRFSCFHSPAQSHKSKKTVHLSTESMQKTLEDYPASQTKKDFAFSTEVPKDSPSNSSSSIIQDSKSEGFKSVNEAMSDDMPHNIKQMRKSMSLGSGLVDYKGRASVEDCSFSSVQNDEKFQKSYSIQLSSNIVNHESVFSIEYPQQSEKEICENSENRFSGGDSSNHTPRAPRAIVKSRSCPFLHSFNANLIRKSRTSDDLKVLNSNKKDETFSNEESRVTQDQETGDQNVVNVDKNGQNHDENPVDESYEAYHYVGSAKDWIVPAVDELDKGKNVQEDYSVCRWEELPNKDFKVKRITKWVLDLQHCPLEETDGPRDLDHQGRNGHNGALDGLTSTSSRNDVKALPGMDSVKKYISSLSPSATAAQLTNHGLVVIPFLSAFSSLKALNLSGNAIVRITAGALPRGLHILNLSKNSISTIEGLRELTRLRVLDLSYNRILRIGHGLASCSSLKELYLAGNKISEVEGLHRLLKLNVLDLRFNKLSTTKNLGQLAANYNSLQAISLEGNPAQKNIGDEHLKKYLLGLLPHLAYFNRQSIKAGAIKDSADRAARLGISAHQIDRGLRSESKRKSTHVRKSQPVATRGRHARLPPTGFKMATNHRQHFQDLTSKVVGFRPDLAIRRTRSEGLLGAI